MTSFPSRLTVPRYMPSNILKNVPLAPLTTLGVGGSAEYFVEVHEREELKEVLTWARHDNVPITILGSGSNVLIFPEGVRGLIIRPHFKGVAYRTEDDHVLVTAGAGVELDELIEELTEKELWGLENLSAIPGTVGAVPIQNVGAYGVEAKDIVHAVTVYDIHSGETNIFTNAMCTFAYRDSLFKQRNKQYIILDVTFRVSKQGKPVLIYKDIQNYFASSLPPTIRDMRTAVQTIRNKKFPDWKKIGTAGSFFKNPRITKERFDILHVAFPELPGHKNADGTMKISLGWVLDRACGLRGYTEGSVGLYTEQALVLVCTKHATGDEIKNFSEKVIRIVYEKINVDIEYEVTFLA